MSAVTGTISQAYGHHTLGTITQLNVTGTITESSVSQVVQPTADSTTVTVDSTLITVDSI